MDPDFISCLAHWSTNHFQKQDPELYQLSYDELHISEELLGNSGGSLWSHRGVWFQEEEICEVTMVCGFPPCPGTNVSISPSFLMDKA